MTVKERRLSCSIKAVDDAAGTVTLYAAIFGNVDRADEVIVPGAFKNLDEFVRDGFLAVNHDWRSLPVATIETAIQDDRGLLLTARWHTTAEAQACRQTVKERLDRGKAVKCSIGYRELETSNELRDGQPVRMLRALEIYEASIVNVPCNAAAGVTAVKGVRPWWRQYEQAVAALKEGRTLSSRNRDRLMGMCTRLREAADDLAALLDETDPSPAPAGEDPTKRVVGDAARKIALRIRALKGRAARGL
jgi:HK97 family phage prohead protease